MKDEFEGGAVTVGMGYNIGALTLIFSPAPTNCLARAPNPLRVIL
jgi:hypothetical protein